MTVDFETWYRSEYPRLVNTLALATGDRSVAVEAASEACTRALAKWERVRRMEHPGGWVYKVALNDARRRFRRRAREIEALEREAWSASATVQPVETNPDLWRAVAQLPERTREAVVLRYVADLTEPAIAEVLGVRRGTVATMLRRAHERLAAELRSVDTTAPPPPIPPPESGQHPGQQRGEYEHVPHR